ncbi:MAG: DUF2851 family protein [Spirosomaceae bacterium]|nr:DUF2851 family protein [Spirosomataceae bacterium]
MTEDFLHFLWKFQRFELRSLTTTSGEKLEVIAFGQHNRDAGPDFQNARLVIGGMAWAGNVEMHLKASDWRRHAHTRDAVYDSVILHVVWENDEDILRADGTPIPTLEMRHLVSPPLLNHYRQLLQSTSQIACASQFQEVNDLTRVGMVHRTAAQRLERKAEFVKILHEQNKQDWEETAYQLLAHNFGFKINGEPMLRLSVRLPFKVLQKHRNNLFQLEALLLGQSGLQAETDDEYTTALQKEYTFLAHKYGLQGGQLKPQEWKFLRLRPANFPTVRLAQLAALIQQQDSLFSLFINVENREQIEKALRVKTSDYWQKHYLLGKETEQKVPALGKSSVENIIINTVAPLLATYAEAKDNQDFLDKAVALEEALPAEQNHITAHWKDLQLTPRTAYESQGVIELYNEFCKPKKCLECSIGATLLRK